MVSKAEIDDFINQKSLAVVGVSRGGKKFSNKAFRELKNRGYRLFPVNPNADTVEGEKCYPDLKSLPEKVGGVLVFVPPAKVEQVVKDALTAGISRVWLQQGAESESAVRFCKENGIGVVYGHCIMMFLEQAAFPHNFHHWILGALGKLPK